MKKFIGAVAALVIILAVPGGASAQSTAGFGGYIESFDAVFSVANNGEVTVTETIDVVFDEERRGIFRDLPQVYKQDFPEPDVDLETAVSSVTDGSGQSLQYQVTKESDNLSLRIGNPNVYITGPQTYVISYTINNVIRFYENHQELFLDVNGTGWNTEARAVTASILLQPRASAALNDKTCITGYFGQDNKECVIDSSGDTLNIATSRTLLASESLSFALSFEKGTFAEPSFIEKYKSVLLRNIFILSPIAVLPWMYRRWSSRGRDIEKLTVVTQFDAPQGVTPAEMGVIADYTADNRDVSSSIIDLAIRGFLRIEDATKKDSAKKRDYIFHLLKSEAEWSRLHSYEQKILKGIFKKGAAGEAVPLKDLKNSFFTTLKAVKAELESNLTSRGYFDENPTIAKGKYMGLAIFVGAFVPIGILTISDGRMAGSALGLLISGLIIGVFARIMPRRTQMGHEAWMHAEGLKQYLEVAEKDRIAMLQAPGSKYALKAEGDSMTVDLFEKLLPYAIVMGVEKQWAEKFEDVYKQAPDWYSGNTNNFNALYLANSLNSGVQTLGSTMSSQPSSSSSSGFSGGGSGGGFGGGGGGSW